MFGGSGEMTQKFSALAALAFDPYTNMVSLQFQGI